MALYINQKPGIGEQIGTGLGQGIGAGINQLLTHKMGQIMRNKQKSEIGEALKSLNIPGAEHLSQLDPELLKPILSGHFKNKYLGKPQGSIGSLIPGLPDDVSSFLDNAEPGLRIAAYNHYKEDPQGFVRNLRKNLPNLNIQPPPAMESDTEANIDNDIQPKQAIPQEQMQPAEQAEINPQVQTQTEQLPIPKVSDLIREGYDKDTAKKIAQDAIKQRNETRKIQEKEKQDEQKAIEKNEKIFFESYQKQEPKFKEVLGIFDEMIDLLESGKVPGRGLTEQIPEGLLKKYAGVESTQAFRTPAERQFNSLARVVQGYDATTLPGPVGKYKLQFFEEQKPSIEHDPETNLAIIRRGREKALNGIDIAEESRRLVSGNKGRIPEGLTTNVHKRANELSENRSKAKPGKIAKIDGKYVEINKNGTYRKISEAEANHLRKVK